MRGHLALTCGAHTVAFFGVRQYHHGLARVGHGGGVGCVNFDHIVTPTLEAVDLLVGHALRQPHQGFVLPKKVLSVVAPVFGGKGLHLPVHGVGKGFEQGPLGVSGQKAVPVAAPHQFDDLPTRSRKQPLQLINNAAVAPHRAVQPLQVAIDHPNQVVQALACGQRERAHGLGLVHFAVAKHAPYLAPLAVEQLAVGQVAHEARLIYGADGPNAHGSCGKLPKIGHQVRVRVAG